MNMTSSRSLLLCCIAAVVPLGAAVAVVAGADIAAGPTTAPSASPTSILTGRPDRADAAPDGAGASTIGPIGLGKPFESLSGAISFRPPENCTPLKEVHTENVAEFESTDKTWSLVVTRKSFPQPKALTEGPDERGHVRPGMMQEFVENLKREYPECKLLRSDLTNLGNNDVGMIVYRFTKNGERLFAQRAMIQANDQLYYLLSLTTPARKDEVKDEETAVPDPGELRAVNTFRHVLDSVKLLDRTAIREDQVNRLFNTRTWFYNLTPQKLSSTMLPEQWNLVLLDGKNVGWQYIVEEPDRKAVQDGIRIGIRTRVSPGGKDKPYPMEESESWMFVSMDRHHEDWSKVTAIDDGITHTTTHPWNKVTEVGSSDLKTSRHTVLKPRVNPNDPIRLEDVYRKGEPGDPEQPWVAMKDDYTLNVQYIGKVMLDPVGRPLPPFYLPQALQAMLPRLLPPNEQKQYLVATYVSDSREVMLRYIDVGAEKQVTLGGRLMRAVPISDRVGLGGAVSMHYVDSRGHYLGTEHKVLEKDPATGKEVERTITILPSEPKTVLAIWPDARLERPGEMGADNGRAEAEPVRGGALVNPVRPNR